ncbi:MAG: PAS domain-containing protein [Anaerolineae bacterium]|nr:PAS domain-containing protein [Anaerolineae bacterium]
MTDSRPQSLTLSAQQQEARGIFGFIRTLGTISERLFRRSYQEQSGAALTPAASPPELGNQLHRRESQIEHLTAVLENLGEGVIMQDSDGRILLMNRAAYQMLGSQKAFWEGPLARLHQQAQNVSGISAELEPLGAPIRAEINNRVLGAQVAAVADSSGQIIGTVIVLRDVTHEVLAERLKDDFITQISHELRTPLTAIKGMSDILLSQPADRPPNRRFLETISRNVDVLDRMIVELLDISEISAGTFAVRHDELALDEVIWSVIRGLQPRWERARLEIHVQSVRPAQARILGDNRRLRWALGHILENSINYTLPGGRIIVRFGELRQGRILIQVEDTGVGIRETDLPHVCERFYRGEARTPDNRLIDPRGLGQGLYIARAVAEAHGGYLSLESKVGVGTRVTLALPTALEPPPDPEATVRHQPLALPPEP